MQENMSKLKNNAELSLLLNLACDLYRAPDTSLPFYEEISVPSIVQLAEKNQMGYFYAKKILKHYEKSLIKDDCLILNESIETHNARFAQMQQALRAVDSVLSDFLVIKSYYHFPRVGADIDIYTPNFEKTLRIFADNGFNKIEAKGQKALFSIHEFKVHLHRNVSWANETTVFIDEDLIWDNPQTVKLGDIEVRIPNANADILMHLAHMIFECFHITLANFFYILSRSRDVEWSIILSQAQKHDWNRALYSSVRLLDKFHHTFYSSECPFSKFSIDHVVFENSNVSIPIPFPRLDLLAAIIDKGLFKWAITQRTIASVRTFLIKG